MKLSFTDDVVGPMYYILYDLRKSTSLAQIHLPLEDEGGPVLLKVSFDSYESIVQDLREMCVNEGDEWMTQLLVVPKNTIRNSSDLERMTPYIMIAHVSMIQKDPRGFVEKLTSMQEWKPN
jgi:hypothetical protein